MRIPRRIRWDIPLLAHTRPPRPPRHGRHRYCWTSPWPSFSCLLHTQHKDKR